MNYPTVLSTPEIETLFPGVYALPTSFFLDRDGRLAQKHVGMLNASRTELETQALAGLTPDSDRRRGGRRQGPPRGGQVRVQNAAQANKIPGIDLAALSPEKRAEVLQAAQHRALHLRLRPHAWRSAASTTRPAPSACRSRRQLVKKIACRADDVRGRCSRGCAISLGDRVSTGAAVREHHSRGESHHAGVLPDAVVFPTSTAEVQADRAGVRRSTGCPMTPFGAGSSLEGHVIPLHGGISIDLTRMNRIVRLNVDDLDVTVEAGVTRKQLDKHLQSTGLMFPLDPGADATLGGMAATRASGTTAVRYGTMRDAVLGSTVVTADGRVVRTGTRARKSSAGYDLTRLFVGAEGTLGIITEVTLRLHGRPEAVAAATCWFDSIDAAVESVIAIVQLGIPVARIELLDEVQMDAVNRLLAAELPGGADARSSSSTGSAPRTSTSTLPRSSAIVDEHGGHDFDAGRLARRRARPVAGAPRRVLRGAGAAPRIARLDDRRMRPDFAAGRLHPRDQSGSRRLAARSARSSATSATAISISIMPVIPSRPEDRRQRSISPTAWSTARWRWTAPARASTASASARCSSWRRSTAAKRSTSCGPSSRRSIR